MDIDDLYELLPDFQCTPGCVECCRSSAPPTRAPVEDERIKKYLEENHMEFPKTHGIPCPHLAEQGCTIHPVRPLICRVYGTSPSYLCKLGVRPVRMLHEDEEVDIFHFYQTEFF
jgi:Fe-S-cluster containining protein